ncbi:hypothetical protein PVOR_18059 [Paenibacillus vortex V453]|uniref:Uncharacterized protein n=1 Tax=Paenibacillus vortex V453 TaxID=715225 RepID=A0A2R9STU6_9BACL|nr:hypothetical protein PVOR_18059 [Paenibacillus vortex V453]
MSMTEEILLQQTIQKTMLIHPGSFGVYVGINS